ncbi:MAG: peptidoglycan endopeptidase, partial [Henriciella sp.]|nr:peptidoglycan endopeptidase [Henriciella sp.]
MPTFDDARLNLPGGGDGVGMQVTAGLVALHKVPAPDAEMATQALHGEHVLLHHREGDFGLIQALSDGYVGWASMAG